LAQDPVKKAADLLRQGATMLGDACPQCGSPLFKLKSGEVVCPEHGRVLVVKSEREELKVKEEVIFSQVEDKLIQGLSKVSSKLEESPEDPEMLTQIIRYLEAIERLKRNR
jgi:UPF0148 protein